MRLPFSKGPSSKEHLVVNGANAPHIHFATDPNIIIRNETFWWQVPVGAGSLGSELHTLGRIDSVNNLTQSKVGNLRVSRNIKQYWRDEGTLGLEPQTKEPIHFTEYLLLAGFRS